MTCPKELKQPAPEIVFITAKELLERKKARIISINKGSASAERTPTSEV